MPPARVPSPPERSGHAAVAQPVPSKFIVYPSIRCQGGVKKPSRCSASLAHPYPTRDQDRIDDASCQSDAGRGDQVSSETSQCDHFAADDGAERNAQEQRAVVPGEHRSALAGEIICQTGLLSRKERLRYSRADAEGGFDQPARVERQPHQQQASAQASKARARGESETEPIGHTATHKNPDDCAATIKEDGCGSLPGREADGSEAGAEVGIDAVEARTPSTIGIKRRTRTTTASGSLAAAPITPAARS